MGLMMSEGAHNIRLLQGFAPDALAAFRQPGQTHLSPLRFRDSFIVGISELERVLRAPFWLLRREPGNPLVQARLLAFLRVYAALLDLGTNPTNALFHMRNTPIRAFRHRTLFEVVQNGHADDAIAYLRSISSGFVG